VNDEQKAEEEKITVTDS